MRESAIALVAGTVFGLGLAVDDEGGLYLTAQLSSSDDFGGGELTAEGSTDMLLIRYATANGAHRWLRQAGGSQSDWGLAVVIAGTSVVTTAEFRQEASFGGEVLTSQGDHDVALASYTTDNDHRWSKSLGGGGHENGHALAADDSGNISESTVSAPLRLTRTPSRRSLGRAGKTCDHGCKYRAKLTDSVAENTRWHSPARARAIRRVA